MLMLACSIANKQVSNLMKMLQKSDFLAKDDKLSFEHKFYMGRSTRRIVKLVNGY